MRSDSEFGSVLLQSGSTFLQELCDSIRNRFGAQIVLIGTLRIAESERVYVMACSKQRADVNFEHYDVCPAPCQRVLTERKIIVYHENLNDIYPDDEGIRAFESVSYVGCPLMDERGKSIGILVLEWATPLSKEKAEMVVQSLSALLPRVSVEVLHVTTEHAFQALMSPADPIAKTDVEIFRTIVQQAAALSQVHGVMLAKCDTAATSQFRVLACVVGDELQRSAEGATFAYDDSPCSYLRKSDTFFCERGVQEKFPAVTFFKDVNAESYLGFGFRNNEGRPVGHLILVHDRPMSQRALTSPILNIIASRARQELQRLAAEEERKLLEESLVVRRKLESLGLMAGTIAHDFNNQLASMIGHTELAMLEMDPTTSAFSSLKVAEKSMWRARDVIAELLDFAGNTPGTPPEMLALGKLVQHTLSTIKTDLPPSCNLKVDIENPLPMILGRPTQVSQILGNLVLNARDALDMNEGTLTVKAALTVPSPEEQRRCLTSHTADMPTPCVMLEVTDTGSGMDAATAARVFDPFFSTKGSARGLGLPGIAGIAKRMNAGLTLNSVPGAGTTFRLYFRPAGEATSMDDPAPNHESESVLPCVKVLVVDDEPEVLKMVALQAESLGYQAIRAASGEAAILKAQADLDI